MIETKIDMTPNTPVLYFKKRNGEWTDALNWAKHARLERPGRWGKNDEDLIAIGPLNPGFDSKGNTDGWGSSIVFSLTPEGRITEGDEKRWSFHLYHDGIDATDEFRALVTGRGIGAEEAERMERIQKMSEEGHFSEVGFALLYAVLYVAGHDFIEMMKARKAAMA